MEAKMNPLSGGGSSEHDDNIDATSDDSDDVLQKLGIPIVEKRIN